MSEYFSVTGKLIDCCLLKSNPVVATLLQLLCQHAATAVDITDAATDKWFYYLVCQSVSLLLLPLCQDTAS